MYKRITIRYRFRASALKTLNVHAAADGKIAVRQLKRLIMSREDINQFHYYLRCQELVTGTFLSSDMELIGDQAVLLVERVPWPWTLPPVHV